jgi:hypothetical protein
VERLIAGAMSPLRDRLFVVVDCVHAQGLKDELVKMGLKPDNFIVWAHNGIEYVYPPQVMTRVFRCSEGQLSELTFRDECERQREFCHWAGGLWGRLRLGWHHPGWCGIDQSRRHPDSGVAGICESDMGTPIFLLGHSAFICELRLA